MPEKTQSWRPSIAFVSFQSSDYRILWFGTLGTAHGFWIQNVLFGWLVLELSNSPFIVGIATALRFIPFSLGPVAGAITDRIDRRRVLQVLVTTQVVLSLLSALLVATGIINVPLTIALGMSFGTVQAFLFTVRHPYIYDIVGPARAMNGIALNNLAFWGMGIPGSVFGGGLIAWLGADGAFYAMGAGYFLALVLFLSLRTGSTYAIGGMLTNFLGGFRLIKQNRTVAMLFGLVFITEILAFSHFAVLPVFAVDVFDVGATGLGLMMGLQAFGSLVGLLGLVALGNISYKGKLLLTASAVFGIGLVGFAISPSFLLGLAAITLTGIVMGAFDTLQQTTLQLNVSEEERGRAVGIWVLGLGIGPLGHVQVGALAQVINAPTALVINGGSLALIVLAIAAASPRLRRV